MQQLLQEQNRGSGAKVGLRIRVCEGVDMDLCVRSKACQRLGRSDHEGTACSAAALHVMLEFLGHLRAAQLGFLLLNPRAGAPGCLKSTCWEPKSCWHISGTMSAVLPASELRPKCGPGQARSVSAL